MLIKATKYGGPTATGCQHVLEAVKFSLKIFFFQTQKDKNCLCRFQAKKISSYPGGGGGT